MPNKLSRKITDVRVRIYIRVLAFKCGNEVAFLYDQRIPLSRAAVTFSAGCDQIRHILIEYMAM